MIRINRLLFILFFILIDGLVYSQDIKQFSTKADEYLNEISTILHSTQNKAYLEKADKLLAVFSERWNQEKFNKLQKQKIYETSNLMLNREMKGFPHFYRFISCLNHFAGIRQPQKSVIAWLKSLDDLIGQTTAKYFLSYLEFTDNFFVSNILFNTRSIIWHFNKGNFFFDYDSVPSIKFKSLDLVCATKKDSSIIKKTKGIYFPNTNQWYGENGKVSWNRVGFDENKVFVKLRNYEINFKNSIYSADSVAFYNTLFFDKPLLGNFNEKVLSSPPNKRTSYPRFDSYFKKYQIDNLFENIDFEGGFSMKGAKLIGAGTDEHFAELVFKKDNKKFAKVRSRAFVIQENKIYSGRAAISMYFENDSIYHPGLQMKYNNENKKLSLIRSNKGISKSPFYDSYHKLDLYCEALNWKMNELSISFEMVRGISNVSKALFESANYYSDYEFYRLQGIDEINPLDVVKKYSERYNTNVIQLNVLADYMQKPIEQVSAMLFNLAGKGFLIYNSEEKKAIIKKELFDFLDAKAGKIDYDVIRFNSTTISKSNAELDLQNFNMTINGVSEVFLSDSQKVYIYPANEEIIIKKNRDFVFSGRVHAGLFDFYAKDCSFEYDTFRLNLPTIDSLSFKVKSNTKDESGNYPLVAINNVIADLSGNLLIDHPLNKSGLKTAPQYPVFNSVNDAYVFYDKKSIHNGVYIRDKFYYHVDPFTIDSLDNFTTDGLEFSGYLASSGTFPEIEEALVVMPDYSLGFVNFIPENGYPVYDDKGTFFSKITLSNNGLIGNGTLKYLTSTTISDNFTFYPDSMNTLAKSFIIDEQIGDVEFPVVSADSVNQKWLPDTNLMTLSAMENHFIMYGRSEFSGELELSPFGLKGNGKFNFTNSEIASDLFNFKQHLLYADTSDFTLFTAETSEIAVSTHIYNTLIDFQERKVEFRSSGVSSLVNFPFNKYVCNMDKIDWYMDEEEMLLTNNIAQQISDIDKMTMKELIDLDLSGSEFISTRPDHDSLAFYSVKAKYDIKNYIIYAEDVKIIKTADAAVFPGDGIINIMQNAEMETLKEAFIITDTATKLHTIYNADVNIFSRNKYLAKGYYDYVDRNGIPQEIELNTIAVDSLGQTFAFGNIPENAIFFLSPEYYFAGNIKLKAKEKNLYFSGGYQLNQECYFSENDWVKFNALINPDEIYLPVSSDLKDIDNLNLQCGLYFSNLQYRVYPALFTKKENSADTEIISAHGRLNFDSTKNEFKIGNAERLRNSGSVENFLSLSTEKCIIDCEGQINIGSDIGYLKIENYGTVEYMIIPDSTKLKVVMSLDFFFDENALEMFSDSLELANLRGVNLSDNNFIMALNHILGKETAREQINEFNLYGAAKKLPPELIHTLFFTEVNLIWNPGTKSFVSYGPIGIGNINKKQINKYVNGYIEIIKRRTGDGINIYLELSEKEWYFFSYRNNIMQAISSNYEFNNLINDLKPESRTFKEKGMDDQYEFVISTRRKRIDFLRKMQSVR